jgi:putative Holliday junction resolvase
MIELGRIMAIDLGEARHGVALSDPMRLIAKSFAVVPRQSRKEDFARFAGIAHTENVTQLLVGIPQALDLPDTPKTAWMRDYAGNLATHLALPLTYYDESYSTVQAAASLSQRGKKKWQQRRDNIDAIAAAMFLQNYLDEAQQS